MLIVSLWIHHGLIDATAQSNEWGEAHPERIQIESAQELKQIHQWDRAIMNTADSRISSVNSTLPPGEHAAWRAFLSVASRALDRIDQALQRQANMTLTDYEILLALAESNDHRLRMSELADQVYVSRSRLTYRVDRLTGVGFVTREECEDDRRGLWAILTDKGGSALEEATPVHHADIRRLLFTALDHGDLGAFESVLQSMSDRINEDR